MMARFHDPRVNVNVPYVLIRRGEAEKDAGEVMLVELGPTLTRAFDAHPRSKELQVLKVGLARPVQLLWEVDFVIEWTRRLLT